MRRPGTPTPTPWQTHSDEEPTLIIANVDGPSDGKYTWTAVADTDSDDIHDASIDIANAAHIVRCVNLHAELMDVARACATAQTLTDLDRAHTLAVAVLAKVGA